MLTGPIALTDKTAPTTVALATLIALEIHKKSFSFPRYPCFSASKRYGAFYVFQISRDCVHVCDFSHQMGIALRKTKPTRMPTVAPITPQPGYDWKAAAFRAYFLPSPRHMRGYSLYFLYFPLGVLAKESGSAGVNGAKL